MNQLLIRETGIPGNPGDVIALDVIRERLLLKRRRLGHGAGGPPP